MPRTSHADRSTDSAHETDDETTVCVEPASEAPRRARVRLDPGTALGRYRVGDVLGTGGMGDVYAAHDPALDREIAIKLLRATAGASKTERARLLREGQALAALSHPNVIAIYDAGEAPQGVFLATELLDGQTLATWKNTVRPWSEVLAVFVAAGRGLQAAHNAGLVHRDFKPANVMRTATGRVVVLDFGLVLADPTAASAESRGGIGGALDELDLDVLEQSDERLTNVGTVMGTPAYMAPEQHMGLDVDERTDQFSFCVALYEALYGRRPFAGSDRASRVEACRTATFAPTTADRVVPRRVRDALRRGLAYEPDDRWPSMDTLLRQLVARRRTKLLAATVVGGSALAVAAWATEPRANAPEIDCTAATDLAAVWSRSRARSIATAMQQSGVAYHAATWAYVEPTIDAWTAQWLDARQQWCAADAQRTSHAAVGACLHSGLQRLALTTEALAAGDERSVEGARGLVALLDDPGDCAQKLGRSSLADAELLVRVQAVSDAIGRASTMREAGRIDEARKVVDDALAEAQAMQRPGLIALATAERGALAQQSADHARVVELYTTAYEAAVEGDRDDLAAEIAVRLASHVRVVEADATGAAQWLRHAEAAMARHGNLPRIEAHLLNTRSNLIGETDPEAAMELLAQLRTLQLQLGDAVGLAHNDLNRAGHEFSVGNMDEAMRLNDRGLAALRQQLGPEHPEVARAMVNLGLYLAKSGDFERSRELCERALTVFVANDDRQSGVAVRLNLAVSLRRTQEYDRAREHLDIAHADALDIFGRDHPTTATIESSLGNLYSAMGQLDRAERWSVRALETRRRLFGDDAEVVGRMLVRVGNIARDRGHFAESLPSFQRAREIAEKNEGRDSVPWASATYSIGLSKRDLGDLAGALVDIERAVDVYGRHHPDPEQEGTMLFALARLRWDLGERDAAMTAMDRATSIAQRLPGKLHKRIERWRREHDA